MFVKYLLWFTALISQIFMQSQSSTSRVGSGSRISSWLCCSSSSPLGWLLRPLVLLVVVALDGHLVVQLR